MRPSSAPGIWSVFLLREREIIKEMLEGIGMYRLIAGALLFALITGCQKGVTGHADPSSPPVAVELSPYANQPSATATSESSEGESESPAADKEKSGDPEEKK